MEIGIITNVNFNAHSLIIDNEFSSNFPAGYTPQKGDMVNYETAWNRTAINVKFICKWDTVWAEYLSALKKGYFISGTHFLEGHFIVYYPQRLAKIFQRDSRLNKSGQLNKYFRYLRLVLGRSKLIQDFRYVERELDIVISLLNYAKSRGSISEEFFTFMVENITLAIKDRENFKDGFIIHLQSLVAYYKFERT